LFQLNANSELIWSKKLKNASINQLSGVVPVSDKGDFVFMGSKSLPGENGNAIWVRLNIKDEKNDCGIENGELKVSPLTISEVQFSFDQVENVSISNWISSTPSAVILNVSSIISCKPQRVFGGGIFCRNTEVQLEAQGGVKYTWFPSDQLDSTNIANPKLKVTKTGWQ